jgi:hypothetical protein
MDDLSVDGSKYFQGILVQEMKNHVHIIHIQDIEKQYGGY